jgi:hypothetical protein
MTTTTLPNGTRVKSQGRTVIEGTVISQVSDLPGWIVVRWDDGQEWQEHVRDVTVIDKDGIG